MRHLFVTTALAAALSVAAAQAQDTPTPEAPAPEADTPQADTQPVPMGQESAPALEPAPIITPPDGYVEGDVVLTTENLEGATVYDASGEEIGEVHGLVFANGTTSLQGGDTGAATAPDATSEAAPAATTEAPAEAPADTTTGAAADTTTDTTTDTTAGAADSPADSASPDGAAPMTESDSSNVATGTDTGDTDRMENIGSDVGTITPTDATTPPAQAPTDAQADAQAEGMGAAEISHAIIDVGGFLGMGEHRVAVPVGDLVVYRKDTDLRIYLPWTREQLEALPEFDEDGPVPATQ
ncbi:MAG: photosystem reaction center protein H [Paracoccus sp. BP8]|nr:MAG: photosystem reaction center protein H [Paracoccus sp. BP8]